MPRLQKQITLRPSLGLILLAAFVAVPLVEIAVLIKVGGWLGLWPTLALIVLTAIVGTALLRQQGLVVLTRAQRQLERGALPLFEVFEGACLLLAGALLLTPGFVTDAVGAALLLPPLRRLIYERLRRRFEPHEGGPPPPWPEGPTVEAEFEEIETEIEADSEEMPPPRGRWGPPR